MNTYIAFLRGINVGGHKKIKMVDLKAVLIDAGFTSVQTYIQSGNIVFKSQETQEICKKLMKDIIEAAFGFQVPTLVLTALQLNEIVENNPFSKEKTQASYYTILSLVPKEEAIRDFGLISFPEEEIIATTTCVYHYTSKGMGKSKYSNNLAERKLQVAATTRNHRTLLKLLEMAQQLS